MIAWPKLFCCFIIVKKRKSWPWKYSWTRAGVTCEQAVEENGETRISKKVGPKNANLMFGKVEVSSSFAFKNSVWVKFILLYSKRHLQEKLEEPVSEPPSPKDLDDPNDITIKTMTSKIKSLRDEVQRLRGQLVASEKERKSLNLLLFLGLKLARLQ